jgi:hypothetical protein
VILSDKHKFIYVAPPKTATTTLYPFFSRYGRQVGTKHRGSLKVYAEKGYSGWKEYFSFVSVRNPWARMVSEYFYSKSRTHLRGFRIKANSLSFEEFVAWRIGEKGAAGTVMHYFVNGHDVNTDIVLPYDDFIRVERLQEDFDRVCASIGLPFKPLGKRNSTKHEHYREYYKSKEIIDLVGHVYAKDISFTGYSF